MESSFPERYPIKEMSFHGMFLWDSSIIGVRNPKKWIGHGKKNRALQKGLGLVLDVNGKREKRTIS
jgi:hypothetical protein